MKACKVCGLIGETDRCDEHPLTPRPRGRAAQLQRLRVADHDRWTCGICIEPIDPTLQHPHPRALHCDHVVARAAGGSDHDDNLRATHAECNLTKGAS